MTFVDIENLFNYLEIHYENNPKIHSKRLKSAWFELLEPYDPKDVKTALLQCLREKRYFPDAQDVAAKCPPQSTPANTQRINDDVAWMKNFLHKKRGAP